MRVKPAAELTLRDRLSQLDHRQVPKLIGPEGAALLPQGGAIEIDITQQVLFGDEYLQVDFPDPDGCDDPLVVSISLDPARRDRLRIECSHPGEAGLLHKAAVLSLVLEEKSALGLAEAPPERDRPLELLEAAELEAKALAERAERAAGEPMKVKTSDRTTPWADYTVTNAASGKSYRVALRGMERGQSYCTCPDFRKNGLGTCKHVLKVQAWAAAKHGRTALAKPWRPLRIAVHARYDGELRLGFEIPARLSAAAAKLLDGWRGRFVADDPGLVALHETVRHLTAAGEELTIYPDAAERLDQVLHRHRMSEWTKAIRRDPSNHPLRTTLLKTELLPYQLDGIAFAAAAGRAVLADEMGLGKTIQGVGVAEFLARTCGISRVLVVCPASLKSQWRIEIGRFCERTAAIVAGSAAARAGMYSDGAFFTICNYEQVLRDLLAVERVPWDLIILDEAQRIKNWEAKTSRVIKSLRSPYALVLTGTPIENRLDDLFSVVEFIDERRLGPAFRFLHGHRVVSETGKVLGYRNLDALRARLRPVLLRRTRASVALDLPPRVTEIVRIPASDEQLKLHNAHMQVVQTIIRKKFLTEMDLLRLQKALLMARLAANATVLVDKQQPGYSTKLERLAELLESLCAEPARKLLIFSEWTGMLDQIEPVLRRLEASYVRLDGSVPQKKRQQLVAGFRDDPGCRAFLTTNAGATGLNLQAADTVINLDLPWNPAVLEQRIARAHRMGQRRKVHVHLLVTEGTIEDNLLSTLSAKHELAAAVLDPDSDLREVELHSGIEELKRRLEVLLGARPHAEPDVSAQQQAEAEAALLANRQQRQARVAEAAGQLFAGAFSLLGATLPQVEPPAAHVEALKAALVEAVETGPDGKPRLTLQLPDAAALDTLAGALGRLLALAAR